MITGKNQIGKQKSAKGSITFRSIDPAKNSETEWLFYQASEDEINEAVELSAEAFDTYRKKSPKDRYQFLVEIGNQLLSDEKEIISMYCIESGLSESRAKAELNRTIFQLKSYGAYAMSEEYLSTIDDQVNDMTLSKTKVPLGPVAVFGSSNFPFAYSTAGGDTASALAAGCTVIVKGHPMHPGTGELVGSAIQRAAEMCDMPDGVFSNLNASDYHVGERLVLHSKVKAVGFTGSIKGGRALFDLAAQRPEPIPVFAEMGSVNPVIFSEKELTEHGSSWAKKLKKSMLDGTGQFCTNPGLIIAMASKGLDCFLEELVEELSMEESTCMLGRGIHQSFDTLREDRMKTSGVMTIFEQKNFMEANFATATVVKVTASVFLGNPNLHHEVFGPFSIVVECGTIEELVKVIQSLEGQLTGTLNCKKEEVEFAKLVIDLLSQKVGRIIFQGVPTGVTVSNAMHHGGPYPATSDSRFTAVGGHAVNRWVRPICLQNVPKEFWIDE